MIKSNGAIKEPKVKNPRNEDVLVTGKMIIVDPISVSQIVVTISGKPGQGLLVNNKLAVVQELHDRYSTEGGKAMAKVRVSDDQAYNRAFYMIKGEPMSKGAEYGVPASGLKKCFDKAIRTTGITDNTTIGSIGRAYFVHADDRGLCRLRFKELVRDIRAVNVGSGAKTVPQMRHRPMFKGWSLDVKIDYNPRMITPESLVNLINHAGTYIGLCELRAEKKQGECGSFLVSATKKS